MLRFVVASVALAATLGAQSTAQRDEEFARRQYESGLSFMQNGRYAEGLKDFQVVIDSFPRSSVAGEALLQVALYQFEIAHDVNAAQAASDRLLKEHPDTDSTAMGHVVAGRITMAKRRAAADVDAALASFERAQRLFPGSPAVPAAGFYGGDALRLARRFDEALDRFRRVAMEYPRSTWAARASLGAAICLVQLDRATHAFDELQRTRQQFPGSPEAARALDYNTIIYRLYVRPPAQPPFTFGRYVGVEASKLKDIIGVAADDQGRVLLGHNKGVSIFDAKATIIKTVASEEPSAFFLDDRGRVVIAHRDVLTAEGGEATPIAVPVAGGKARPAEEMASIGGLSNGDRLIADRKGKAVIRVSADGKFLGTLATVNAERLAVSRFDDVAMLDRDSKTVVVADRNGQTLTRLPAKGPGYDFNSAVDLAFDALGHLYVLARNKPAIFVFGPKNRLIATIAMGEKDPGAFQRPDALALDAAGRLYVFDDRSQRIQVYQ